MTETSLQSAGARHKQLLAARPAPLRHPYSEFEISQKTAIANELRYPRAGVRQQADGKWLVLVWYAPQVVRKDDIPLTYWSRMTALQTAKDEADEARHDQLPTHQVRLHGVSRKWAA